MCCQSVDTPKGISIKSASLPPAWLPIKETLPCERLLSAEGAGGKCWLIHFAHVGWGIPLCTEVRTLDVVPRIILAHQLLLVANNEKNTTPQAGQAVHYTVWFHVFNKCFFAQRWGWKERRQGSTVMDSAPAWSQRHGVMILTPGYIVESSEKLKNNSNHQLQRSQPWDPGWGWAPGAFLGSSGDSNVQLESSITA